MNPQTSMWAVLVTALLVTGSGCASKSFYADAAAREQRAADDLRRGGATEAGRAAQARADENLKNASCWSFLECAVDLIFSIRIK